MLCFTAALYIANSIPPATGYELSLWNAFPDIFWYLTNIASITSVIILVIESTKKTLRSKWWISGVIGLISTNVLIISLPLFRGYPINDRADTLNHIGFVKDILITGKISEIDFYPSMHFIQLALQEIGGIEPGAAIIIINMVFMVLWTLGTGAFVYAIAQDLRAAYLALAFTAPLSLLSYHNLALPSTLSAYFIPVLLALHLKRTRRGIPGIRSVIITEIILAFLIVYFHPATTLYIIGMLIALEVFPKAYNILLFRNVPVYFTERIQKVSGIATIMVIAFFEWYFSFSVFTKNFAGTILWLLGERDRGSAMQEAIGLVQTASLPVDELQQILFNSFGVPLVLFGYVCFLILLISIIGWRRKIKLRSEYVAMMGLLFMATTYLVVNFVLSTSERYPLRLLRVLVILSIGCAAWWSWDLLFGNFRKRYIPKYRKTVQIWEAGITVFLAILIIISQFNVYPHPRNGQPNGQVTENEITGMKWLVYNWDIGTMQASILPEYVPRFDSYFKGFAGRRERKNWWISDLWLPSHFYEDSWTCIAKIIPNTTTYLVLSENGKIAPLRFPEEVRDRAHIYTDEDWQVLAKDASVNKVYDNGDFEIWVTRKELSSCGNNLKNRIRQITTR